MISSNLLMVLRITAAHGDELSQDAVIFGSLLMVLHIAFALGEIILGATVISYTF